MPLFPAYASKEAGECRDVVNIGSQSQDMIWESTNSREAQLLASDSDEEPAAKRTSLSPPLSTSCDDFYLDSKLDRGNLRVSTLYYPGRPQYERRGKVIAGGAATARSPADARRARRYWVRRAPDAADAPAAAARAAAYRDLLLERPENVYLWEQYIDFEEVCGGAEAALAAAERAAERLPRSRRLRLRLVQAARAALPRERLLQRLRDLIAHEKSPRARADLWCTLVEEAGALGGGAGGAAAARAAAAAALADTRAHPPAYPRLLHAYGVFLRTAGLWEELVLLAELAADMAGAPPPAPLPPLAAERRLLQAEERALASGLPLPALWVRVERARAAAHWRPAPAADLAALAADPQRAPLAHDVAELLRPLVGASHALLLCATLLRLAKVPLFPDSGYMQRAWGAAAGDCAEALLPALRAARRLSPAHAAHPARPGRPARRLLAALLDPPHYFTDDAGYLSWVRALWDACCGWAAGERRAALLGWRLRWLHALLLLAEPAPDGAASEAARIRDEAREVLQRFTAGGACGPAAPLAFAQFARIECAAGAPERAVRVASRALRAALQDASAPRHHALYIARIVFEVSGGDAAGACALVSAVRGRAPPLDMCAPAEDELHAALLACEERCAELERRHAGGAPGEEGGAGAAQGAEGAEGEAAQCLAALLPAEAEWGAARALLAPPARRAGLLRALPAVLQGAGGEPSASAERYFEQSACALVLAGAPERRAAAARSLSQLFPHNAYLALAGAGAPLWAWRGAGPDAGLRVRPPPRTPSIALAALLPVLLRAHAADWAPQEAEACTRAVRRLAGAAPGALLGALRLEAEGRAPRPRLLPALYAALERAPHAKWLYVRGAACCGGEAATLADALLDRQLRAHALLDELAALVPSAQSAHE